jgi:hypothetical protein
MMILSTNPEWGDRPTYVGTLEYYSVALLASLGIGSERLAGVGPPSPQWPYDTGRGGSNDSVVCIYMTTHHHL